MVAAFRVDSPGEKRTEAVVEVPGTIERPSEKSVFGEASEYCSFQGFGFCNCKCRTTDVSKTEGNGLLSQSSR